MVDKDYKLRKLYSDIIQGSSPTIYKKEKIFIRHFSPIEQGEIDGEYLSFFDIAVGQGLNTDKQRLQSLFVQGLWSEDEEKQLESWNRELQGKQDTKRNLVFLSQIEEVNKDIDKLTRQINMKNQEKRILLGMTAETFAHRKLNEVYIFNSLFKDKHFQEMLFDKEEFDEIDEIELDEISTIYNEEINPFHGGIIPKIALSPFFQRIFGLCEDNIYNLFGKPLVRLTYFQAELGKQGKDFKNILGGERKPPSNVVDDPEKLIEWYNAGASAKRVLDTHDNSQVQSLVGGTQEDIKKIAESQGKEVVSLAEVAAKEGKTKLNMRDLMKVLQN